MITFLFRILFALLLLIPATLAVAAENAQISHVLVLQDDSVAKIFVDVSKQSQYKAFVLQGPTRAVIDFEGAVLAPNFTIPSTSGWVTSIRQGKTTTGIRLVFDLSQNVKISTRWDTSADVPHLAIELIPFDATPATGAVKKSALNLPPVSVSEKPVGAPVPSKPAPVTATELDAVETQPNRVIPTIKSTALDDQIAQIEIDSQASKPITVTPSPTTLSNKPATTAPAVSGSAKKIKTINDIMGSSARKLIVAIDAGHGGKDPGAHGPTGVNEKDITLRVATELAAAINAEPGMKAVLIRDNDTFVPLQERYMKARKLQADLFVSIHADAAENNAANGSSVFVLSTKGASSQAARWLADKENAVDLVGGVSLDDKDKRVSAVLLDLSQSYTMRMSEDAAEIVLRSLKDLGKTHKREIEHANFVVLRSPDVPSMLIETGFITNPVEEKKLSDPVHRKKLAFALAQGIRNFFKQQALPGTYYAKKEPSSNPSLNTGVQSNP